MVELAEFAALQAENARLTTLLEAHNIQWRLPTPIAASILVPESSRLSTAGKVALFRRLFRGRTDVYPVRWESKTTGKSGYAPACANEWRAGVCNKPRIKCSDGGSRMLIAFSDSVLYGHLSGDYTVGVYPLLDDDTCFFLAVDFDEVQWQDDARAFVQSCDELGVPVALEIAQAMRMSVWDKPRVIGSAENYPQHIALPRGCLNAALDLLHENGIRCELRDERYSGESINVAFVGTLRPDQEAAVAGMLKFDTGVLCAPTAFGKTVTAAALISRRGVKTLILVHRTELLKQWQERLQAFLGVDKSVIGTIGGGKAKATGKIDIAVMQSLSRQGEVNPLVENYGHVIVDECHHVGAASFDAILKRTKAKFVIGLTATPIRRDGQQPIIFMQCGPIRHRAATPTGAPHDLQVVPHARRSLIDLPADAGIQDVFHYLANDFARTEAIAAEVRTAFGLGRKVLVLTERTEHLAAIQKALAELEPPVFVLHGRMSKKQRATLIAALEALPPNSPRVLLSTGKLVGEGFDHPPLDTLVLAMPVSWKGTLQQYAGRLHREHASKTEVRIIDIVDTGHPSLIRMWDKRQRGYRAMGYRMATEGRAE